VPVFYRLRRFARNRAASIVALIARSRLPPAAGSP
jgi:hypothetical protein